MAHLQAEGKEKTVLVRLLGTAPVCVLLSPFSRVPWLCFSLFDPRRKEPVEFSNPKRG